MVERTLQPAPCTAACLPAGLTRLYCPGTCQWSHTKRSEVALSGFPTLQGMAGPGDCSCAGNASPTAAAIQKGHFHPMGRHHAPLAPRTSGHSAPAAATQCPESLAAGLCALPPASPGTPLPLAAARCRHCPPLPLLAAPPSTPLRAPLPLPALLLPLQSPSITAMLRAHVKHKDPGTEAGILVAQPPARQWTSRLLFSPAALSAATLRRTLAAPVLLGVTEQGRRACRVVNEHLACAIRLSLPGGGRYAALYVRVPMLNRYLEARDRQAA